MDESVAAYIEAVFATDDVLSKLRVVQAIVTLLEKHPRERAIGACRRASTYGAFTYAAVRDILRQGLDLAALPEPMFPESSASSGRFARSPQSLPVH